MLAAGRIPLFFMTATHSTIAAPELSMQFSIVYALLVLDAMSLLIHLSSP